MISLSVYDHGRKWLVVQVEAEVVLYADTGTSNVVSSYARGRLFSCGAVLKFPSDETKPKCLRCKEADLECTGFPADVLFINVNPAQKKVRRQKRRPSTVIAPPLALDVLGDHVLFSYLTKEMNSGNSSTLPDTRWPGFLAIEMPDSLPLHCIRAFAASFFGKRHGYDRAQKQGTRLYVESVQELNRCLTRAEDKAAGQTLMSIAILSICEVRPVVRSLGSD
jgi:hypothetical protein